MDKEKQMHEVEIDTLGYHLNRALWTMIKKQNDLIKKSSLNHLQHAEFIVLKALNDLEGASQSQLSKIMCVDKAAISRTLNILEKKGYIERKPLNGSTNYVTLSEEGKEFIPEINEISDKVTATAFKGFSKKRRVATIDILTKMYINMYFDQD